VSRTDRIPDYLRARFSRYCAAMLFLLLLGTGPGHAIEQGKSVQQNLTLPSGEEISFDVFGQDNQLRVLWIAPNFGIRPRHRQVAETLGQRGMEVWQTDLAESLFLPGNSDTMRQIPANLVADIITALSDHGHYQVLVISGVYGAIPALRGIHAWQSRYPEFKTLVGAIFFSPYFFTHVPELGQSPDFIPELYTTNIPVYIFEAAKNGNRWHLPAMLSALQQHAPVYTEIMKGVTSLYYEEDTSPRTLAMLKLMPDKIIHASKILQKHDTPLTAIPLPETDKIHTAKQSRLDTRLKTYHGEVQPLPFSLQDTNGRIYQSSSYHGKITIINFWASWCSPCVKEIPSLNHLKQKMAGKPFEMISINYAESPEHIRSFMKKVNVNFPVLVDPDGKLTSKWKVVAFPSTFVIGPDGRVRYGVNAAIQWDTPEVIRQLMMLLPEKQT
jgi:peroxiredoxin